MNMGDAHASFRIFLNAEDILAHTHTHTHTHAHTRRYLRHLPLTMLSLKTRTQRLSTFFKLRLVARNGPCSYSPERLNAASYHARAATQSPTTLWPKPSAVEGGANETTQASAANRP
jgi:hypothetical protein